MTGFGKFTIFVKLVDKMCTNCGNDRLFACDGPVRREEKKSLHKIRAENGRTLLHSPIANFYCQRAYRAIIRVGADGLMRGGRTVDHSNQIFRLCGLPSPADASEYLTARRPNVPLSK
jgi:hypothetical protein